MHKWIPVFLVASAMVLGGCASKRAKPPADAGAAGAGAATAAGDAAGASTSGMDSATADAADDTVAGPMGEQLSKRVVYFDFDRDELRPGDAAVVAAHGRYLAGNSGMRVRLEGHTDERGTREYNIGLGERRAQAVRRALMLQGVSDQQLSTVSYGEERAAAAGSDETAWSQNRRVEIVYVK